MMDTCNSISNTSSYDRILQLATIATEIIEGKDKMNNHYSLLLATSPTSNFSTTTSLSPSSEDNEINLKSKSFSIKKTNMILPGMVPTESIVYSNMIQSHSRQNLIKTAIEKISEDEEEEQIEKSNREKGHEEEIEVEDASPENVEEDKEEATKAQVTFSSPSLPPTPTCYYSNPHYYHPSSSKKIMMKHLPILPNHSNFFSNSPHHQKNKIMHQQLKCTNSSSWNNLQQIKSIAKRKNYKNHKISNAKFSQLSSLFLQATATTGTGTLKASQRPTKENILKPREISNSKESKHANETRNDSAPVSSSASASVTATTCVSAPITSMDPTIAASTSSLSSSAISSILIKDITLNELRPYFNQPILNVSKKFGICITLMKKICRKNGILRWPHRRIRSLINRIISVELVIKKHRASCNNILELKRLERLKTYLCNELKDVIENPNIKSKRAATNATSGTLIEEEEEIIEDANERNSNIYRTTNSIPTANMNSTIKTTTIPAVAAATGQNKNTRIVINNNTTIPSYFQQKKKNDIIKRRRNEGILYKKVDGNDDEEEKDEYENKEYNEEMNERRKRKKINE